MFLEYGVNKAGELVHIAQSVRGRTPLQCPYCQQNLIARKGAQLAHHFAHDGDTCRDSADRLERLTVPFFDSFDMHLSPKVWATLQAFHANDPGGWQVSLDTLINAGLVQQSGNPYSREYVLTHEGKVPFGEAPLQSFADFQIGEITRKHGQLVDTVRSAAGWNTFTKGRGWQPNKPQTEQIALALADLELYRAQVGRLFNLDLYLLEITHAGGTLHKIGVTSRAIDERIKEIERDLRTAGITTREIKPLRVLEHRGAVERYALHRYRQWSKRVGTHGEYFQFEDGNRAGGVGWVKSDFTRLGDFEALHGDERYMFDNPERGITAPGLMSEILAGDRAAVAIEVDKWRAEREAQERAEQHRQATIEGMERAKAQGVHVGRPAKSAGEIINEYPAVVRALQNGASLRRAAAAGGVSPNTARKVRDAMQGK